MHVALAKPCGGDSDKAAFLAKLLDGLAAAVAHASSEPPDQLVNAAGQSPLIGNAPLNPLGNKLVLLRFSLLAVPIPPTPLHGAQRTHAPVDLVGSTLEDDCLTRAFLGPRQQTPKHHGMRPGRNRLGHVARELDAAVGNNRDTMSVGDFRAFGDRRDLRDSCSGDYPSRTDGAWTDPDLQAIGPGFNQLLGPFGRGDVSGDEIGR